MKISFNGEPESRKSFFSNCFKDEPKRKLITLFGNKRKKLIKSKYKKRFVESKNYVPNLIKKIRKSQSKKYGGIFNVIFDGKYPDINLEEVRKQGKDVWVVLPDNMQ